LSTHGFVMRLEGDISARSPSHWTSAQHASKTRCRPNGT